LSPALGGRLGDQERAGDLVDPQTAQRATSAIGCAGRCGGADSNTAPAPAMTDDKPPNREGHDPRLEF
jgi:hypothetical protein